MATIAYLRVSTKSQDLEKNKGDIALYVNDMGLGPVTFVEESVSRKVSWKGKKLFNVIQGMMEGDVLIVSELSRLGGNMLECIEVLSYCLNARISVHALKGGWRLDNTIQSKIVAMGLSIASEIECDLISQRTKEALRVKKENGVALGRPRGPGKSKLDKNLTEITAMINNGVKQSFIAKKFNTTQANLSVFIKKRNIKK